MVNAINRMAALALYNEIVGVLKSIRETIEIQIGETRTVFETIRDELDRQIEELRRRMAKIAEL